MAMEWKNQLTKTPYLVLFIVLISMGVGTASALITITLAGNVIVTGDLTVDSDTLVVDSTNNRVGIGTDSPDRKFDVRGTITSQTPSNLNSNNIQIKRPGDVSSTNVAFVFSERNSNDDLWLYGFDGSTFKNFVGFDFPEGKVSFPPAGGNTLVIDEANDKVGIGTSSPVEELEVVGNVRATPIIGQWISTIFTGPTLFAIFTSEKINTDATYFEVDTLTKEYIQIKKSGYYLINLHVKFKDGVLGEFTNAKVWRYNSNDIQQEQICRINSIMAGSNLESECSSLQFFDANDRVKLENASTQNGFLGNETYLYIQRLN